MSNKQTPSVKHSNIANGYADIAIHLGYRPQDVFFMHSLVTNPGDSHDLKFCATDDLDVRALQYSVGLMGQGSNAFQFPSDPYHEEYLNRYVIEGNLMRVAPINNERLYPGGSLPAALITTIQDQSDLGTHFIGQMSGKVIVNSYATKEVEKLCVLTGATPLMPADDYLKFVSKAYVHSVAEETGLSIAPGIVFNEPASTSYYAQEIQALSQKHQATNSDVWIKAAALSGGQGIFKVQQLDTETVGTAFHAIAAGYEGAGFFGQKQSSVRHPFNGINYFMPIVAELDICSLPHIKEIVINSCVQAVVGSNGITMTGTALQQTKDGEYIGGVTPEKDQAEPVAIAEQEAIKFLKKTHKDGYRGYGGVDVIVARTDDNKLVPFVLEFNPRLNASTPLLSLTQRAEQKIGPVAGQICSLTLPENKGSIQDMYKVIGPELYRGEETGFTGVIPTVVDPYPGRDTTFRIVTIGQNADDVAKRFTNVQKRAKALYL